MSLRLPSGHEVLVDKEDEELVRKFRWQVNVQRATNYAVHRPYPAGDKGKPGTPIRMHRLIMGARPGEIVDHVNGDGLDNRRANLRVCDNAENHWNGNTRRPNNTSGYKGVTLCRATGRWRALIWRRGRRVHLGYFDTPEVAAAAYDKAALRLFGAFARTNLPAEGPEMAGKPG